MSDERGARMSSVLGSTAIVLGNVSGQGDLEIRGHVQGNVTLDGRVAVATGGIVLGAIEAVHVTVLGTVRGDLIARDGVTIGASGEVEGNIVAPRVAIEAGARVRGNLRTGETNEKPRSADKPRAPSAEPPARTPEPRAAEPLAPAPAPARPVPSDVRTPPVVEPLRPAPTVVSTDPLTKDEGEQQRRKRRRRRGGGGDEARSASPRTETPAGGRPAAVAHTPAPAAAATPAPGRTAPSGPAPQGPPAIPTFVKGAHGHRRDN